MALLIVYTLALVLFSLAFFYSGIGDSCKGFIVISRKAIGTIADKSLEDHSKEKIVREASLDMLKQTILLFIKISVTLCFTLAPLLAADGLDIVSFQETSEFALRLDVLIATTTLIVVFIAIKKRLSNKA